MMNKLDDPINLSINEYLPNIWLVTSESRFDLAMTFLRAQEFYESDQELVKSSQFKVLDYIRWYAKNRYDRFSYATDWAGFNVPSDTIREVLSKSEGNIYDEKMQEIVNSIDPGGTKSFYLIGTNDPTEHQLLEHELAHAFYFLDKEYRSCTLDLIKRIDPEIKNSIYQRLKSMGYSQDVWEDEFQAYMVSDIRTLGPGLKAEEETNAFKMLFSSKLELAKLKKR